MRPLMLCCVLLAVLCAGCGSTRAGRETAVAVTVRAYSTTSAATATATHATVQPALLNQLNNMKRKWQSSGITSYRIRVRQGNPFGHVADVTITVRSGLVVTYLPHCQSMNQPNCVYGEGSEEAYTVSRLFDAVQEKISDSQRLVDHLTFDPAYGLPMSFGSHTDQHTDSFFTLEVEEFVVLR